MVNGLVLISAFLLLLSSQSAFHYKLQSYLNPLQSCFCTSVKKHDINLKLSYRL